MREAIFEATVQTSSGEEVAGALLATMQPTCGGGEAEEEPFLGYDDADFFGEV